MKKIRLQPQTLFQRNIYVDIALQKEAKVWLLVKYSRFNTNFNKTMGYYEYWEADNGY